MPGSISGTSFWGTNPLYQNVGGEVYFYLNDQRGAPCQMVNKSGMVVWIANYDAFGKADVRVETVSNNLRLPGQYFDLESGLHYNWHRHYEPETGRYMSVDPVRDGMNYYAYCSGEPLGNIDPWGLLTQSELEEYVDLADAAYDPNSLPSGWSIAEPPVNNPSGLDAYVFKNDSTGQVVIAFAGTEGHGDVKADLIQAAGGISSQYIVMVT